jgi:hypothetical protein
MEVFVNYEIKKGNFSCIIYIKGDSNSSPKIISKEGVSEKIFPLFAEAVLSAFAYENSKIYFSSQEVFSDFLTRVHGEIYEDLSQTAKKILKDEETLWSKVEFLVPIEPKRIPFWKRTLGFITLITKEKTNSVRKKFCELFKEKLNQEKPLKLEIA